MDDLFIAVVMVFVVSIVIQINRWDDRRRSVMTDEQKRQDDEDNRKSAWNYN